MCLVERGSICSVLMTALGLGGYAWASHTPSPSREGRFGCLFFVGNGGLSVEDSPLERGLRGVLR